MQLVGWRVSRVAVSAPSEEKVGVWKILKQVVFVIMQSFSAKMFSLASSDKRNL